MPTITLSATSNTVCAGNTVALTASGANSYTWSTTETTTTISATPTVTTNYTVTGTDGNGCMNMDTLSIIVENCTTGMNQLSINNEQLSVYPNPANNILNVVLRQAQDDNATLVITDMMGNTVKQSIMYNSQSLINVADLADGIYNISISTNDGVVNKRLIITR